MPRVLDQRNALVAARQVEVDNRQERRPSHTDGNDECELDDRDSAPPTCVTDQPGRADEAAVRAQLLRSGESSTQGPPEGSRRRGVRRPMTADSGCSTQGPRPPEVRSRLGSERHSECGCADAEHRCSKPPRGVGPTRSSTGQLDQAVPCDKPCRDDEDRRKEPVYSERVRPVITKCWIHSYQVARGRFAPKSS